MVTFFETNPHLKKDNGEPFSIDEITTKMNMLEPSAKRSKTELLQCKGCLNNETMFGVCYECERELCIKCLNYHSQIPCKEHGKLLSLEYLRQRLIHKPMPFIMPPIPNELRYLVKRGAGTLYSGQCVLFYPEPEKRVTIGMITFFKKSIDLRNNPATFVLFII